MLSRSSSGRADTQVPLPLRTSSPFRSLPLLECPLSRLQPYQAAAVFSAHYYFRRNPAVDPGQQMRAVIQRVLEGSVEVEGKLVSQIGAGLLAYIGITEEDTPDDLEWLAHKLVNLRLFESAEDPSKRWNRSVLQVNGDILLVSQFTLHSVVKGNKPDFHLSMNAERARPFFDRFVAVVRQSYSTPSSSPSPSPSIATTTTTPLQQQSSTTESSKQKVQTGVFGAYMHVHSVVDGPVNIILDSKAR